jgi:hypothetical protein
MPGSPRMTRRSISLVVQESANYDSRVFPAQRLARSLENPVPCRPVSATKRGSPIATRDASYPQRSELLRFFRDERSEHAFHSRRRCRRVESSRVDSTREPCAISSIESMRARASRCKERHAAHASVVYTHTYICTCVGTYLLLAPCSSTRW